MQHQYAVIYCYYATVYVDAENEDEARKKASLPDSGELQVSMPDEIQVEEVDGRL